MLVLTNQTLTIDKFKEIITNINQTFNNPVWLDQSKTYFKIQTIHNLFCNYYFERVIKSNTFSYFLKQLELLLIEHLPTLYTKSISHLDGVFEKMLDSEFWRAKSKSYNLNKQNSLNQDGSMPSSQNLLSELDKTKIEEIYLASSRYDQRQSSGEFNRIVVNLVDEYILKNNINVNMGILDWLKNFESLFSNFIIAKDDNIRELIEDSDIQKILTIFNKFDKGELKGERGEQGQKGERGERGEQGVPGIQGIQGTRGEKGEKGNQGLPGTPGLQGERGLKGDRGEKGEKGERGEKGDPGRITDEDIVRILQQHPQLKGEKGDRGERGPQGERGQNGTNGSSFRSQDVNLWQVPNFNKVLNAIKANYEIKRGLVQNGLLVDDGTVGKTSEQITRELIINLTRETNSQIQTNISQLQSKISELEQTTARVLALQIPDLNTIKIFVNEQLGLSTLKEEFREIRDRIDVDQNNTSGNLGDKEILRKFNEIIEQIWYARSQISQRPPKINKVGYKIITGDNVTNVNWRIQNSVTDGF